MQAGACWDLKREMKDFLLRLGIEMKGLPGPGLDLMIKLEMRETGLKI